MNIGSFIYDIFNRIIDMTRQLGDFLNTTITIGDLEVSFLGLLGGVGLVALIIASIARG